MINRNDYPDINNYHYTVENRENDILLPSTPIVYPVTNLSNYVRGKSRTKCNGKCKYR